MTSHADVVPISAARARTEASVRGRIVSIRVEPRDAAPQLTARIDDGSGRLDVVFMGRREVPGIEPGAIVSVHGRVSAAEALPRIFNPEYTL
ncbi:OB-fold nucleic acid binding domain-containing protein [Demequina globuliformis]|uniref:OB-fold nucleic acid binding domain-containing protein n=1 Tax=Demequina globuliformis TaxID=676202 RepID=UPI0007812A22|nr:OB-fold nucleic acid binding domain-containing protein [Demequina globuliformis]